ncbi:TetR/AcrR family transcriptional regulator [Oceanobacillus sp. J11TS1]|uniref:TetR/AcrR family transcriptional regulator n=1 Tax=Oceanobacillus sp. J11TS1 TaxID=2807191 RepID=UPI001B0B18DB|nr:TetR/AcrR family transcriptional regulator [Oceanobacillus sp. J11TS1]GIO24438.1 TetR family transcriptional regulator [Oceanobacillus sp. J11TS1]
MTINKGFDILGLRPLGRMSGLKRKIMDAGLAAFAASGYEGASLSQIAKEVGIKKPSIYTHFASKEALYITIVKEALKKQKRSIFNYFEKNKEKKLEEQLYGFLEWIALEIEQHPDVHFIYRITYFPPASLEREIFQLIDPFLNDLQRLLTRYIKRYAAKIQWELTEEPATIALTYMTILDGSILELFFTGKKSYERRKKASWVIFWKGVKGGTSIG